MMRRVLVLIGVVVAVALSVWLLPTEAAITATVDLERAVTSLAGTTGAADSVWMCAAAQSSATTPGRHVITISNPSSASVSAKVTSYLPPAADGRRPDPVSIEVAVAALSVVALGAEQFAGGEPGSVTVEAPTQVVVSHRIFADSLADEAPCASSGSNRWFFPSANSQLGGSARLWIFNPFSSDASIKFTATTDGAVLDLKSLGGVVIPARSTRVVELGDAVQRRDQFAVALESRGASVVAELVETTDGTKLPDGAVQSKGIRIQPGIGSTASRILFADGEGVDGVGERIWVFNPNPDPITVTVSVRPDDASPDVYPEPFQVELDGLRYQLIDLAAESRLPPTGRRTITVETDAPGGVVATRVLTVLGQSGWPLTSGTASSIGAHVAATQWMLARVDGADAGRSILRIVNTSPDSIAVVTLTVITNGAENPAGSVARVEVPPGRAQTVDIGSVVVGDAPAMMRIVASSPVVVDRRAFGASNGDLWTTTAIAVRGSLSRLDPLPRGLGAGK